MQERIEEIELRGAAGAGAPGRGARGGAPLLPRRACGPLSRRHGARARSRRPTISQTDKREEERWQLMEPRRRQRRLLRGGAADPAGALRPRPDRARPQGRDRPRRRAQGEIRRVIQILCRRTKNNPVLIGEAGVGKTAIVEGLAQQIVRRRRARDRSSTRRSSRSTWARSWPAPKYRGEFEERMKAVLKEIAAPRERSSSSSTSCTRSSARAPPRARWTPRNMLKPALARGELHCVGATTLDEYRKYIEKDAALERRFQPVTVGEPPVEDTIAILRGLRSATRSTTASASRTRPGRRRHALAPLHRRSLPARQGDRPRSTRPPRRSASRSIRCRPRSTRSTAASCSSRSSSPRCARRRTRPPRSAAPRSRPSCPSSRSARRR